MHTLHARTLLGLLVVATLLLLGCDDGDSPGDTTVDTAPDTGGDTAEPGDTVDPGDTAEPGDTTDAGDDTTDPGDTADVEDTADPDATDTTDPGDTTDTSDAPGDADAMDMADMGGGGEGPWTWCPDSAAYVGDSSWPFEVEVTTDALYCGLANEGFIDWESMSILWDQQRDHRAQMWLAPGSYDLPDTEGTFAYQLPICLSVSSPDQGMELDGTGELQVTINTFGEQTYYDYVYRQTVISSGASASESSGQLEVRFSGEAPASGPGRVLTLDGSAFDPFGESNWYFSATLCTPDCQSGLYRGLDSCHFEGYDLRRHNVTFVGGEVELDLRYGVSAASTEPGQFLRAEGTLDGTAFSHDTYWELVYTPAHHHFERHFMVLFDAPIGGVCAMAVEHLEEFDDEFGPEPQVRLLDCDLALIESRKVTADTFTRISP